MSGSASTSFSSGSDKSTSIWLQSTFNCIAPAHQEVVCTAFLTKRKVTVPYWQVWRHKDYGCECRVEGEFQDDDSAYLKLKVDNLTTGQSGEAEPDLVEEGDQKPADWEDYDPEMNHMNGEVPEVISD